jgi:hypothetical protein
MACLRASTQSIFGVLMVLSRLLMGTFVAATAAAHAQSPAQPAASAPATKLQYQSAFADYRPYVDVEILSWAESNDGAARLGGHMGQMKHGAMPAMAPKSESPMAQPPATGSPAPTGSAAPGAMKVH